VITRDVRFTNELKLDNKYEDIISSKTTNGRFKVLDNSPQDIRGDETEIAPSIITETSSENHNEIQGHSENESLDHVNNDNIDVIQVKRGPERPRIVRTKRVERPAKQYNMVKNEPNRNSENGAASSDEENITWHEAELAMNSMKISFKEAISGSDRDEWKDAIYTEIKCLVKNNTWKIVDKPMGTKVLGCRTVLRNKYSSDGSLKRRKARVVAQGFAQRPDVDFNDTFAPVARLSSFRLLIALSAEYNMCIEQLDVTSAFLNGEIDTDIHETTRTFGGDASEDYSRRTRYPTRYKSNDDDRGFNRS